jgi:hypothetical protein
MSNTESIVAKTTKATPTDKPQAAPAKKVAAKKAPKLAKPASPAPAAKKPAARTAAKPAKVVVATTPTPGPAKASSPAKVKQKLVRDSFTMPRGDFGLINILKERALTFRRPTKKSELLRAGLHALSSLPDAKLKLVLDGLVPLKTGRPKKDE